MATNYNHIAAVGQMNDMACWAASLKWWYKAVLSINASQTKLWDRYKGLRDSLGGMTPTGIRRIISENAMFLVEYQNASGFTIDEAKRLLGCGPIYIAFTESGTQKRHVNVIYKATGDSTYGEVHAMEPQAKDKGNGKWGGKLMKKPINDFNILGTIHCGVLRTAALGIGSS